jgi:hypothetical protein
MRYASPAAFRTGLEARLPSQSRADGVDLGRLRRRVVFERLLARLARGSDAGWVPTSYCLSTRGLAQTPTCSP